MKARTIWYDQAEVNKAMVTWGIVFALLVVTTLRVAAHKPESSVPVLSHLGLLLLASYWMTCLAYTLVLFAGLRAGRTWSPYPLFILLQVAGVWLDSGRDSFRDIADTWHNDAYLLVPFFIR